MDLQANVIWAVFKRNLVSFFANPIGYLFITVYILISGYVAFSHENRFFTSNLADLEQLHQWFPYLLVLLVPAVTAGSWADERRSGTDELLLTLPGSDLSIVLGKYLACLAAYSAALLFSLSHVIVLLRLGRPD